MKRPNRTAPFNRTPGKGTCPLRPAEDGGCASDPPAVLVIRTERRSWFTLAITGFGALLLRYLKTVRERAWESRKSERGKPK